MSSAPTSHERETRTVDDVQVRITELIWPDGGRSFEVHRVDTEEDLTEDWCFDESPSDDQIRGLLREHLTDNQAAPR
jgi:hypothetical protein